ncbi:MAG: hypothetical protein ACR2Q3_05200 [Woeseiaceae bacterium]
MPYNNDIQTTEKAVDSQPSIWRLALNSVFGAAVRLHQYRDARDTLFRRVFHEQEMRFLAESCCDE